MSNYRNHGAELRIIATDYEPGSPQRAALTAAISALTVDEEAVDRPYATWLEIIRHPDGHSNRSAIRAALQAANCPGAAPAGGPPHQCGHVTSDGWREALRHLESRDHPGSRAVAMIRAHMEQLEENAARYCHLRNHTSVMLDGDNRWLTSHRLDAVVDARRNQG